MTALLDLSNEFDLRGRIYLDGASQGPMARRAIAAAERALDWKRDPSGLNDREYFALPDRIRGAASELLGCCPQDIAVATGASHGISLVACGLDWRADDHVVVPTGEFPANNLPWLGLRALGVEVEFVDPDDVSEAICPRTRAVSVGHVNFATGRRLDLDDIGAACERHDALFLVDASQSAGAIPLDVVRCKATVVAIAGYKWLMSPYGTGITYVHPEWVGQFRLPAFNWATIVGADDFNRLADLVPQHRPGAIRFDVPETAAFIHGAAMAESLELLVETGVDAVNAHATCLLDRLIAGLPDSFRIASPLAPGQRSTIMRLVGRRADLTLEAHARLREAGVGVSLREGGLRVAPGIWNAERDIDVFLASLSDL
ncbi:MAG TPA: aminotransferase class V-fold PLP-dependent enzyme [Acidobacteriota bacterium]|nr:aminotransferase class V-fold PLP-dependent enzyme [Acidobacteriota bacterium]